MLAKNRRPARNPLPVALYNTYVYIFYKACGTRICSRVHMIMRFGFVKNRYTFGGGGDGGGSGGGGILTCTFGIIYYYVYYIFSFLYTNTTHAEPLFRNVYTYLYI